MSPNPLTPGLEFFKTCLSAFWKPESKHGNVLKNLELSGRHIAPNAELGVPRSFCSGKRVGVELPRAWLQDRVKFDLGYCLGVEGVELASRMSSSLFL